MTDLVRVSVLVSREDYSRLETYCAQQGAKKSTLISKILREFLDQKNVPVQPSLGM